MKGKICLITGASSGIGKVAAIQLAQQGAHVIIHGRDVAKTIATKNEIVQITGNQQIDIVTGDLGLMEEVRKVADHIHSTIDKLDILINNAGGIMNEERAATKEGHEKTIALNFLGPFLLTALLFDLLKKSAQARIINTTSMVYTSARPDLQDFEMNKKYTSLMAYGNAKLYLILFTMELDKRLKAANIHHIAVTAFHPGVVRTNFSQGTNSRLKLVFIFFKWFLLSPEKGADTMVYLATADEAAHFGGSYIKKRKKAQVKEKFLLPEQTTRLWQMAEQVTGATWNFS